jgi:hypothetical protein
VFACQLSTVKRKMVPRTMLMYHRLMSVSFTLATVKTSMIWGELLKRTPEADTEEDLEEEAALWEETFTFWNRERKRAQPEELMESEEEEEDPEVEEEATNLMLVRRRKKELRENQTTQRQRQRMTKTQATDDQTAGVMSTERATHGVPEKHLGVPTHPVTHTMI